MYLFALTGLIQRLASRLFDMPDWCCVYIKRSDGFEFSCAYYRNPNGTKENLDEGIAVCTNGVHPYAQFPLPEAAVVGSRRISGLLHEHPGGSGPAPYQQNHLHL